MRTITSRLRSVHEKTKAMSAATMNAYSDADCPDEPTFSEPSCHIRLHAHVTSCLCPLFHVSARAGVHAFMCPRLHQFMRDHRPRRLRARRPTTLSSRDRAPRDPGRRSAERRNRSSVTRSGKDRATPSGAPHAAISVCGTVTSWDVAASSSPARAQQAFPAARLSQSSH